MHDVIRRSMMSGLAGGFRLLPASAARRLAAVRLIAPLYHVVADEAPAHVRHLFAVRSTRTFSNDLDFFVRAYTPVTLAQVHAHCGDRQPLPARAMFLSFDDGMREVADVIAPMLLRRGLPATFFLNSAFVDNRSLFYRHKASLLCAKIEQIPAKQLSSLRASLSAAGVDAANHQSLKRSILAVGYADREQLDALAQILGVDFAVFLREQRPYLDSEQIKALLAQGFTIGAHSVDHPRYAKIGLDEQLRQTRESTNFLMERFGITTRDLAFPFVSDGVGGDFYDAAYQQQKLDALFCLGGIATEDPRNVERVWMEGDATTPAEQIVREFYLKRWQSRRREAAGKR